MRYSIHETIKTRLIATGINPSYQIALEHSSFTLTHGACYHEGRPILLADEWQ
jgi:hypothetical protein